MMPVIPPALTPSAEHGFTLVELLAAMVASIAVIGALLAIIDLSLAEDARVTDRVQADQVGRTALTRITDELHSSCTGFGATAIQAPGVTPSSPLAMTGPVDLWFLSAYGNASSANAVLTGVTEHDVKWVSTGTSNTGQALGTLTDYRFTSTGGSAPNWQFPALSVANAHAVVLAKNTIAPQISGVATLFQYYKYNATGQLLALSSGEVSSATEKGEVAKVAISFIQAPEDGDTRADRIANLSDAVVLRFNSSQTATQNKPCA